MINLPPLASGIGPPWPTPSMTSTQHTRLVQLSASYPPLCTPTPVQLTVGCDSVLSAMRLCGSTGPLSRIVSEPMKSSHGVLGPAAPGEGTRLFSLYLESLLSDPGDQPGSGVKHSFHKNVLSTSCGSGPDLTGRIALDIHSMFL